MNVNSVQNRLFLEVVVFQRNHVETYWCGDAHSNHHQHLLGDAHFSFALTAVLAGYSHVSHRRSAEIAAREIMERSAEDLELKTKALIDPSEDAVQDLASWPVVEALPSIDGHTAKGLLLDPPASQPQISTASIGYDNGSFYMIGSVQSGPAVRLNEPIQSFSNKLYLPDLMV